MVYFFILPILFAGLIFAISIINSWIRTSQLRRNARFGMDKLVHVRKTRIHFVEFGNGPSLILLPGLFETYRTWNSILPALSKNFRCICLNYFGSCDSEFPREFKNNLSGLSEFIIDFLDRLHLEITHVLGVGFGGSLLFDLASRFPLCIHRGVAIEGLIEFFPEADIYEERLYSIFKRPLTGSLSYPIYQSGFWTKSRAKKILHSVWNEMSRNERQNFLNDQVLSIFEFSRVPALRLMKSWHQNENLAAGALKIEVPILQLMGTESEYSKIIEPTNTILKQVPSVTRWLVQDGIHQLQWQYPHWVAQVITHYLKEENVFSRRNSGGLWEVQVS